MWCNILNRTTLLQSLIRALKYGLFYLRMPPNRHSKTNPEGPVTPRIYSTIAITWTNLRVMGCGHVYTCDWSNCCDHSTKNGSCNCLHSSNTIVEWPWLNHYPTLNPNLTPCPKSKATCFSCVLWNFKQ